MMKIQSHAMPGCGSAKAGSSPMEEARWRSHWRHDPGVRRPKLRGKRCHKSHHGLWKCCLSQGPKWRKVRLRCHELGSKVITGARRKRRCQIHFPVGSHIAWQRPQRQKECENNALRHNKDVRVKDSGQLVGAAPRWPRQSS